mmetsp:Transcript_73815/g.220262  ORF Transcript_73815/g.220262 Transcript_73815/m.220262 type:complete len:271 (-) Transcript_73815:102-914(-)
MCDLWSPASDASTAAFSQDSTSSPDAAGLARELQEARTELAGLEAKVKRYREVLKLVAPFVVVAGQPTIELGLRKVLQHGWNSVHWAQGYTLLHYVGENGNDSRLAELVAWLADTAAAVEVPDEKGKRPLDYAKTNPCKGVLTAFEKARQRQRRVVWQDQASPSSSPTRRSRSSRGGVDLLRPRRRRSDPASVSRDRSSSNRFSRLPWVSPGRHEMLSPLPKPFTALVLEEGKYLEAARTQAPRSWAPARPKGDDHAESQGGFKRMGLIF